MADITPSFDPGGALINADAPERPREPPPRITQEQYARFPAGLEFIAADDPEGTVRIKPYATPTDAPSWRKIPENAPFIDPEGQTRYKPRYEGVDTGTQTMIEMAHGDERQLQLILAGQYKGGEVKREPFTGDYYVEKDGKRYKPGAGSILSRGTAKAISEVAPTIGTIGGGIIGAGGGIPTGPGAIVSGMAGAGLGAGGGEAFNQGVLALLGYPSTVGETAKHLALSAAGGGIGQGAGAVVGRGIDATVAGAKALGEGIPKHALARMISKWTGVQPLLFQEAQRLAELYPELPVHMSKYATESPWLRKAEHFDTHEFRKQNVNRMAAEQFYLNQLAKDETGLFARLGLTAPPKLTDPASPPRTQEFGEHMLTVARTRMEADERVLEEMRARVQNTATSTAETQRALAAAEQAARQSAQDLVDAEFISIGADMHGMIQAAGAHENPGDLARRFYEKAVGLRMAIRGKATQMYDKADTFTDVRPNSSGLVPFARQFIDDVPEGFKGRYKQLSQAIEALAPPSEEAVEAAAKAGKPLPAWEPPTFGQLHKLRTMLRQEVDERDLTSTVRDGAYKSFIGEINGVLKDQMAHPELKQAADLLQKADDFYAKNVAKFRSQSLKWTVDQMEAGVPVDPAGLAQQFLRPNQTEEIAMLRKVGGKPLWSAVLAADTQAMIQASRTAARGGAAVGEIDGRQFADQVVQRYRSGILDAAYDRPLANRLLNQAENIQRLDPKGEIPLAVEPGDTVSTLMRRAEALAQEQVALAKANPVKVLSEEAKAVEARQAEARSNDPLGFLHAPKLGALTAADEILKSPDRIIAMSRQFGPDSPEFTMLRQVWTERLFQRELGDTAHLAGEFSTSIRPEVQELMLPGTTLADARQLARDMQFLLSTGGSDMQAGLAGGAKVMNPSASFPEPFRHNIAFRYLPDAIKRMTLGKFYAVLVDGTSSAAFRRFLAAGLRSGDPAMRDLARRDFQKWLSRSGAAGGELVGGRDEDIKPPGGTRTIVPWREIQQGQPR